MGDGATAAADATATATAKAAATATATATAPERMTTPTGVRCPACEATAMPIAGWCPFCMEPLQASAWSSYAALGSAPQGWDLEDFEVFGPAGAEGPCAQIIAGPWPARSHLVTHASWRQRAVATLIDGSVFVPALVALAFSPLIGVILLVAAMVFSLWQQCWRQGVTGQTLGKRSVGIFLVDEATLAPVGTRRATLRQLAHGIDAALLGVGYLWPLWDPRRQTFADQLLGTVVAATT